MTIKTINGFIDWLKGWFYDKDEIDALIPKNTPIRIPTSDNHVDLNEYLEAGFYYFDGDNTTIQWVDNYPSTFREFVMLVESHSQYYVKQTVTSFGSDIPINYVRLRRGSTGGTNNDGWRDWKRIQYTS